MRRDEPTRHGRAADALIASYLRELVADEPTTPASVAAGERAAAPSMPLTAAPAPSGELTTDATA